MTIVLTIKPRQKSAKSPIAIKTKIIALIKRISNFIMGK
jgi:hypothetical protein